MRLQSLPAIAAGLLLTACQPTGGLATSDGRTPPGVDARADGEDGLIVGHRLMDAGEYELALKAYMRAAGEVGVNSDVLSAIGSANLRLGRLGQAEQILRQALKEEASRVFTQPNVDANAAEALRQKMLAQHDQMSKRRMQAMVEVSKVLTPDQRRQLAELRKRGNEMRERHRREREALMPGGRP